MDFGLATAKGREQRPRIGTNEDHEWRRMNANKKVVARSWSAASLARPTAVGAMALTFTVQVKTVVTRFILAPTHFLSTLDAVRT